jgi:hypothetical protein
MYMYEVIDINVYLLVYYDILIIFLGGNLSCLSSLCCLVNLLQRAVQRWKVTKAGRKLLI